MATRTAPSKYRHQQLIAKADGQMTWTCSHEACDFESTIGVGTTNLVVMLGRWNRHVIAARA